MANIICNNCNTKQKARILESSVPAGLVGSAELKRYFLLVVDRCSKCKQKKIKALGYTHNENFVEFGFLKTKNFLTAEKEAWYVEELPEKSKKAEKSGFYLYYSEYGKKDRCYSNLSNLKIGLFDYGYGLGNHEH